MAVFARVEIRQFHISPVIKATMPRHIAGEDPDLTVGDLGSQSGILPSNASEGLALLQKSGLIDHQNGVLIGKRLKRIVTRDIAQILRAPLAASE